MSRRFGVVTLVATCFALSGAASLPSYANNSSCGGCTAYVRQATLDWWWPWSISHTAGFIYTTNNTYYLATAAPMNSSAAVSALLTPSTYDYTYITQTIPESSTYTVSTSSFYHATPTAAATSFVTISSAKSVPTTGTIPSKWDKYFYQHVGTPTIAVTGPAVTDDIIISQPTGYVYYTEYEVESRSEVTGKDGSVSCSVATSTYQLSAPAGFSYGDNATFTQSTVSDALPTDFALAMDDASCIASSFEAEATVIAVITAGYNKRFSFKIAHHESSALSLDLPSITPPPTKKPTKKPTKRPGSGFGLAIGSTKGGQSSGGSGKTPTAKTKSPGSSRPAAASSTKKAGTSKNGGSQNNPGANTSGTPGATSTKKGQVQVMASQPSKNPSKPANQQLSPSKGDHHPGHPIKKPHTVGLQVGTPKPGPDSTSPPIVEAAPPVITVGGHTYTPNAATQYSIAGKTLTPGGTVTVSGTAVALNKQGNSLVEASSIEGITPKGAMTTPPPALLIGPSSVTAEPSQGPKGPTYIVSGQTLTPSGAVTVGGTTYSLPEEPTVLVVNGMTQFLPLPLPTRVPATLSYDGKIYTAQNSGGDLNGPVFVINGQTLTAGGDITISNTQLSLAPDASTLVLDGTVHSLKATPSGQGPTTKPPVLTVGGTTYQGNGGTTYTINGQTLTPGQQITVSGTTIRLLPSATAVVVNGKTTALFPATGVPKSTSVKTTTTSSGSESSSTKGGSNPTSNPTSSPSSTPALAPPTMRAGNLWGFAGLIGALAFA